MKKTKNIIFIACCCFINLSINAMQNHEISYEAEAKVFLESNEISDPADQEIAVIAGLIALNSDKFYELAFALVAETKEARSQKHIVIPQANQEILAADYVLKSIEPRRIGRRGRNRLENKGISNAIEKLPIMAKWDDHADGRYPLGGRLFADVFRIVKTVHPGISGRGYIYEPNELEVKN